MSSNTAGGRCSLFKRRSANAIGVSKAGFFAANGAHANTALYIKRAIFHQAVFQHPGFMYAGLKIQISKIELMIE
jgi:hypothetical protein